MTTDDSLAAGVAVLQSTTEAPTSKYFKISPNEPPPILRSF